MYYHIIITSIVDGRQENGVCWPEDAPYQGTKDRLDEGAYVNTDSDEHDLKGRVMCIHPNEVALKSG